jgi:peptidoglycan/LPS O-acetylase OafA/YrhL
MVVRKAPLSARKLASLDGIRGLAILAVMLHHGAWRFPLWNHPAQAVAWLLYLGWSGVDLFFVLSGFLITGILLDSRGALNYFRSFYARRALRIFPLYYVFLSAAFVFFPVVVTADWMPVNGDRWLYFCYLTNWEVLWKGPWRHTVMAHLWSLAVEEQFYFCWPLVVWMLRPRTLLPTLLAGEAAVICGRIWWVLGHGPSEAVAIATVTRMDGLLLGAVCAVLVRRCVFPERVLRALPVAGMCGLWLFIAGSLANRNPDRFAQLAGFPLLAASFAAFVLYAALTDGKPGAVQKFLSLPALTNTGKYAYGLYIYHVPLFYFGDRLIGGLPAAVREAPGFGYAATLVSMAIAYVTAKLSYDLFERRFLNWKSRFATVGL